MQPCTALEEQCGVVEGMDCVFMIPNRVIAFALLSRIELGLEKRMEQDREATIDDSIDTLGKGLGWQH